MEQGTRFKGSNGLLDMKAQFAFQMGSLVWFDTIGLFREMFPNCARLCIIIHMCKREISSLDAHHYQTRNMNSLIHYTYTEGGVGVSS